MVEGEVGGGGGMRQQTAPHNKGDAATVGGPRPGDGLIVRGSKIGKL